MLRFDVFPENSSPTGLTRHGGWLTRTSPAWAAYLVAALTALWVVQGLLPIFFIVGDAAFFETGDAAWNIAGWWFYASDSLHWPILWTLRANTPEGVSVAMTDSIPLAALIFKPVARWFSEGFHYMGLMAALGYFLQALGVTFALRGLGHRSLAAAILGSLFAVSFPAFLNRLGHISLTAQGVLFFAFGIYLRDVRSKPLNGFSARLNLGLLAASTVYVHAYLAAMVIPLYWVLLIRQMSVKAIRKAEAFIWFSGQLLLVLVLLWAGGFLAGGEVLTTKDYGVYSLNLLAPFCGGRLCDFAAHILPYQEYESVNYLGLGLLSLWVINFICHPKDWLVSINRHAWLACLYVLFGLYAVSHQISLGPQLIATLPLPNRLIEFAGLFRASARFFWPVGTALLVFVLHRWLSARSPALVLVVAIAAALQWWDTEPYRERVALEASAQSALNYDAWQAALKPYTHMAVFPVNDSFGTREGHYLPIYLAARSGLTCNAAITGRQNSTAAKAGGATRWDKAELGTIYVLAQLSLSRLFPPDLFRNLAAEGHCRQAFDALWCSTDLDAAAWVKISDANPDLADLNHRRWSAAELRTTIGRLEGAALVPADPNVAGCLSFGPYVSVPPDQYIAHLTYRSKEPFETRVGSWDVVSQLGAVTHAQGDLMGTAGMVKTMDAIFETSEPETAIEVRTFRPANAVDLAILALDIERIAK